jgi:hypothetical protein
MLYFPFNGANVSGDISLASGVRDERAVAALAAAERDMNVQGYMAGHGIIIAEVIYLLPFPAKERGKGERRFVIRFFYFFIRVHE